MKSLSVPTSSRMFKSSLHVLQGGGNAGKQNPPESLRMKVTLELEQRTELFHFCSPEWREHFL